jgi:hypothetical protein
MFCGCSLNFFYAFTILASLFGFSLLAQEISYIDSYNPVVRDGYNIWLEAELLFWQPWEKALVATNQKADVFTTDNFTQASLVHPHFDWSVGYRLHSGYLFAANHWDVEGIWTHFSSHISQKRSAGDDPFIGMFPIWSFADDILAGDYVFTSDLKWKLTINILDLQFGRYFNPSSWFNIKPFLGLRSLWLQQHGNVVYQGGIFLIGILQPGVSLNGTDYIKLKNNYWGLGPRVGLAPRFILGKGFSLNMEGAVSGFAGFFTVSQKETYLDTTRFSRDTTLNRLRWMVDCAAGITWKTLLAQERYSLIFGVDWEYQVFFHQFELKKDHFGLIPNNRNLSVQGVTGSIRFDF